MTAPGTEKLADLLVRLHNRFRDFDEEPGFRVEDDALLREVHAALPPALQARLKGPQAPYLHFEPYPPAQGA